MFDIIYNNLTKKERTAELNDPNHEIKTLIKTDEKKVWFVFLGWGQSVEDAISYNLIPNKGTVVIFQEPKNLVNPNPNTARKIFIDIYNKFKDEEKKFQSFEKNVLSISLGNLHGFYISNKHNISKFISIVPGRKMGDSIFYGIATQEVMRRSIELGFSSSEEYNKIFEEFDTINNTDNLPDNTTINIAQFDYFNPTKHGLNLVNKAKSNNPKIKLKRTYILGHILSIFYFSFKNKLKLIKW